MNQPLIDNTPVEKHGDIWVKREDLCATPPAPPFSKVRGLYAHLQYLQSRHGITTVGYTETSISMAGWGVAWACADLGLRCIIFDPQYKNPPALLRFHRRQWRKFGARLIPLPAGRAMVNYYKSRKIIKEKYGEKGWILPLGLPFPETIQANAREVENTINNWGEPGTIVCNSGSGTMVSGILRGIQDRDIDVYGICGRNTKDVRIKRRHILAKGPGLGEEQEGNSDNRLFKEREFMSVPEIAKFLDISTTTVIMWTKKGWLTPSHVVNGKRMYKKRIYPFQFRLIDPEWEYTQSCDISVPFPCHPYYDRKAWKWLQENKNHLKKPILFWNIGSIWRDPKEALYVRK